MNAAQILGEAIAGWLFADFVTGLFHWWEDRIGRVDMPFIGKWLIEPNRLHHSDPMAFTGGTLADRSLASAVAACTLATLWVLAFGPSVFCLAFAIGGSVVNEVHRLAHLGKAAGLIGMLQEVGLLQSPAHHAGHHRGAHDRRYLVLTDMLNPVLDRLKVWDRLENALRRVGFVGGGS